MSPLLTNYLKRIDHFLFTTGMFKVLLSNLQVSSRSFSKYHEKCFHLNSNTVFHTTLGHEVNFIAEIQKQ